MKTEDLILLGVGGYLLYNSISKGSADLPITPAAPTPTITPSASGPTSTSLGEVPSAFGFPYNVVVKNIEAVGSGGEIYGTYTTKATTSTGAIVDVGTSGKIPQIATNYNISQQAAAPVNSEWSSSSSLTKTLASNVISSVSNPIGSGATSIIKSSSTGTVSSVYLNSSNPAQAANAAAWAASGKTIPMSLR